jgi:hypothetical protein
MLGSPRIEMTAISTPAKIEKIEAMKLNTSTSFGREPPKK